MPLETLPSKTFHQLSHDLSGLSRRAVQADVKDSAGAMELALAFEAWAARARKSCGEWSSTFHQKAQELVQELKAGLPAARAMELLLRALLQSHRLLEKEEKGKPEKETDLPATLLSPKPFLEEAAGAKEKLYVRPEDQGLFQLFLQEAPTFLSGIQSNLLLLGSNQKADLPQTYQLFHVLTGQWGFLGFLQMRRLCRAAESLLEPFLSGGADPAPCLDLLLRALGACRSQVDCIARGLSKEYVEVWDATPVLEDLQSRVAQPPAGTNPFIGENSNPSFAPPSGYSQRTETPTGPPPIFPGSEDHGEKFEGLLELMGELVSSQSPFLEEALAQNLKGKNAADAAHIGKVTRQMRDVLLSLRMVPLKPLFDRLSWELTRISKKVGKTVYLAVESPDLEVDRPLLAGLVAPLSQLIQNAVEHGIESPEERVRAGKLPEGMLKIKAVQQSGSIVLELEDDGRGLNLEKLRQRGLELGLLENEKTSPARVMEMIFKPGLTTLDGAGEGRGRGLDQVEAGIEELYGSIRVQSKPGQGCKFTLKLPRTQALIEGWVVELAGNHYLLPLSQVKKITHPAPLGAEKETAEDASAPLLDLDPWLGEKKATEGPKFSVYIEAGANRFRIRVDEVHGKQQVLVRKKGGEKQHKPGIREEAVLPDGNAVWVLDTRQFVQV